MYAQVSSMAQRATREWPEHYSPAWPAPAGNACRLESSRGASWTTVMARSLTGSAVESSCPSSLQRTVIKSSSRSSTAALMTAWPSWVTRQRRERGILGDEAAYVEAFHETRDLGAAPGIGGRGRAEQLGAHVPVAEAVR